MRHCFKSALLVVGTALVQGCAWLSIGNNDYACGAPNGVACISSRDAYNSTHNGQTPQPMTNQEIKALKKERDGTEHTNNHGHSNQTASARPRRSVSGDQEGNGHINVLDEQFVERDEVLETYVAPRLPDRPIPIRTPAEVMRIWIAPWEDTNGDLNVTGYVYTEVEKRRWVIGKETGAGERIYAPLRTYGH